MNLREIKEATLILKENIGSVYKKLKTEINKQISETLTLMNINIDLNMVQSKNEEFYKDIKIEINDGITSPLSSKGTGLQSLILIELYKFYCRVFNNSSLIIIEEPELYLHPHAKRMLSDMLREFIIKDNIDIGNQIILTTHSTEFIQNIDLKNINVIKKEDGETKKYSINEGNYNPKELQKIKVELQYKNAEMFFAEKVILVEGEEKVLIPYLIKKHYRSDIINVNDVSIIKVGGKSYFKIYKKILEEMKIDNYIIADYDIIENGIEELLDNIDKQEICNIKSKIPRELKGEKDFKKETETRDWLELCEKLEKMIITKQYDENIENIWNNFKVRTLKNKSIDELDAINKNELIKFIEKIYLKNIFILKKGELEDYYKKQNFGDEFNGISGKGLVAYKISELCQNNIDKIADYIEDEEYKIFFDKIFNKEEK